MCPSDFALPPGNFCPLRWVPATLRLPFPSSWQPSSCPANPPRIKAACESGERRAQGKGAIRFDCLPRAPCVVNMGGSWRERRGSGDRCAEDGRSPLHVCLSVLSCCTCYRGRSCPPSSFMPGEVDFERAYRAAAHGAACSRKRRFARTLVYTLWLLFFLRFGHALHIGTYEPHQPICCL